MRVILIGILLLSSSTSFADGLKTEHTQNLSEFVTPELFFMEALEDFSDADPSSLVISKDLTGVSEIKKANFNAKQEFHNVKGAELETYQVFFRAGDNQISCLGTILPINHKIMDHEAAKDFVSRSGRVYMSECEIGKGQLAVAVPPSFEMSFFKAFPKAETLPIGGGTTLDRYKLFKTIDTDEKLMHCQSRDSNAFDTPRSVVSVYNMENHYSVGMLIASSSTNPMDPDLPLDMGAVDEDSLGWVKDNIEFFKKFSSSHGSVFNVMFEKSNCLSMGSEEEGMTFMRCEVSIPKENQVRDIEKVIFQYETELVSKPVIVGDGVEMISFANYKGSIEFVVDQKNKYHDFPKTHYRNSWTYQNVQGGGNECLFADEIPKSETKTNEVKVSGDVEA